MYSIHGRFVSHVTGDEADALHTMLMEDSASYWNRTDADGNTYTLRGSSVIRITPEGEKTIVIHRAAWKTVFQSPDILTCSYVLMIIFFVRGDGQEALTDILMACAVQGVCMNCKKILFLM